ncbi:MAG: metal-dependent hydrolase [Bryobacteraceae bacterium]|jgi:inner membrane protein
MDNLTHTAVGLFLARAGAGKWSPRATAILLVASNAPDIDVLAGAAGPLAYLHYHRHLTHALIAMPVLALLSVAVVRVAGRKPLYWPGALAAGMLGVAAHLLLDWTNLYGVRLLLPFSGRWLRLDSTAVVDLWIWAIAAAALAGPFLARLVGSEIASGGAKPRHHGRTAALFALAAVMALDGGRLVLHSRAVEMLEARVYQGDSPTRVAALPNPFNPLRWRGLVETPAFYAIADVDTGGDFDPTRAQILYKPDADPALDAAARTPVFREFLRFNQYPLWRVTPAPTLDGGKLVELFDLRFGTPSAPGFLASALVDARLRVVDATFRFGALRPR